MTGLAEISVDFNHFIAFQYYRACYVYPPGRAVQLPFFEFGRLSVGYLKTRSVIGYRSAIYKKNVNKTVISNFSFEQFN